MLIEKYPADSFFGDIPVSEIYSRVDILEEDQQSPLRCPDHGT